MTIDTNATYAVTKYDRDITSEIGPLPGADVKKLLKGYTYDKDFGMWFSKAATIGYDVRKA
jgi:hypothetical protein